MLSRAYTSFLHSYITSQLVLPKRVNALSGLYLISTKSQKLLFKLESKTSVNALSGLYLISTG